MLIIRFYFFDFFSLKWPSFKNDAKTAGLVAYHSKIFIRLSSLWGSLFDTGEDK